MTTPAVPPTLAAALAAVQAQLPDIRKTETAKVATKTGGSYEYSYADLADVSRAVLPLLGQHGLSFLAKPTLTEAGRFVLAYKLLHVSGDHEAGEYPLPSGTAQEIGSAITYARRYVLCAITGATPDRDDDGSDANKVAVRAPADDAREERWRDDEQRSRPANSARTRPTTPAAPVTPSQSQMRAMHASFAEAQMDRDAALQFCGEIIGRAIGTTKELTPAEASQVIDRLKSWIRQQQPPGEPTEDAPEDADAATGARELVDA